MSNRPYEQEGQVRTDEQAGAPDTQLKRVEREFDAANPPVAGTDPRESRATTATLTTSLAGANNDLTFTAKNAGSAGNNISVTYTDPGGVTATLGIVVSGTDITVNLGRAASAINTTAAALATAVAADIGANNLVRVANASGNDGTGLVTAMAKTNLAGGSETGEPARTFRQKDQIRSSEQDPVQSEIAKRYTDS
jgi:hypothetical protein